MNLRPMDTILKAQMSPSLALLTIKALTPKEHEVFIINENIEKIPYDIKVDLAAITVTVDVFPKACEISAEFKKRGIAVVAGGIHITAAPDEALKYFDAICIGMAERVWKKILIDKSNNSLEKIYCNMNDMLGEEIYSPEYSLENSKKYLYVNILSASRGCIYKCDFCYNSCKNSVKYMNKPIETVIDEIKRIGRKHVMFIDDNFIGNPKWTKEFLERIKPLKLKWNAAVSADILEYLSLLDLMKESGCRSLFIGFESINGSSLKSVHKTQNKIEKYDKLISEIHARGIMINASLVFGLPDDDVGVFQNTLDWLVKNKIETMTAHILTPYPGTKLYDDMMKKGKITDFDLSHYNTAHVVFQPENMTKTELLNGYILIYKKFYSFRNIIKRMPDYKGGKAPFLLFNLFYRKFGKFTSVLSKIIPLGILGKTAAYLSYGKIK